MNLALFTYLLVMTQAIFRLNPDTKIIEGTAKTISCKDGLNSLTYLHKLLDRLRSSRLTDRDLGQILLAVQRSCRDVDVESWETLCEVKCYAGRRRQGYMDCTLGSSSWNEDCYQ